MKTNKVLAISVILLLMLSAAGLVYTNVLARPMGVATAPGLGAASSFSALAALSASSANTTTLGGDLGLSPGVESSRTGPWSVGGSEYFGPTTLAGNAQTDALGAYNNLAGQSSDGTWSVATSPAPGVWTESSSATFTGTLTLNGGYDDVWVFQIPASLTFSGSVVMGGEAQACHVFWQVGEDTTIASGSSFVGTIITENNTTLVSGASVSGRVISLVGALTTDNNSITMPPCASAPSLNPTNQQSENPIATGLPDNPQPESGSTEAAMGTATARAGVPSTGGAPLQGDGSVLLLTSIIGLSGVLLFFAIRKLREIFGSK
jgi:hypothetical protein